MASNKSFISPQPVEKPRMRQNLDTGEWQAVPTSDSFQNFLTRTGVGAGNIGGAGRYGFNPISRNRLLVEWAYRGSWVVGTIVDCIAEDMTSRGVEIQCDDKPEDIADLEGKITELQVWSQLEDVIKWARLYGGAIGLLMIDGQKVDTPFDPKTVGVGQFKGVLPIDRWSLFPSMGELVKDLGPDVGNPMFYELRPDPGTGLEYMKIHYSRIIRLEGVRLPYWQRITENYWGQSVIERLYDRLIAFDSSTDGAAQLVYKAHLRTYKVEGLRKIIATGGAAVDGLLKQIQMIRQFQSNEGLTLMDASDEFEVHPYSFDGLDDILLQFGQQLSGASQIPLVRLFGQSPAGLNATGESDLRMYYDGIKRQQTKGTFHPGTTKLYHCAYRSQFGRNLPKGFKLEFNSLWQMDDVDRAQVGSTTTSTVLEPYEKGITAKSTTLKELRQSSKVTGLWTNITDEMIDAAEKEDGGLPPTAEQLGLGPEAGGGIAHPLAQPTKPVPDAGLEEDKPGKDTKDSTEDRAGGETLRDAAA